MTTAQELGNYFHNHCHSGSVQTKARNTTEDFQTGQVDIYVHSYICHGVKYYGVVLGVHDNTHILTNNNRIASLSLLDRMITMKLATKGKTRDPRTNSISLTEAPYQ